MNDIDKKIARKIADSFEEYADGLENQGWTELRKKYPPKRDVRPLVWWMSAAAVILLSLSIGLYFIGRHDKPEIIASKPTEGTKSGTYAQEKHSTPVKPADLSSLKKLEENKPTSNTPDLASATSPVASNTNRSLPADKSLTEIKKSVETPKNDTRYGSVTVKVSGITIIQPATGDVLNVPERIDLPKERLVFPYYALAARPVSGPGVITSQQPLFALPKPVVAPHLLDTSPDMLASNENLEKDNKPEDNKPSFDIYTSAFVNYAEKSNAPLNAGAGFNASIPMGKRIDLVVGGGISNNTLHFGQNNVPNPIADAYKSSMQNIGVGGQLNQSATNEAFDAHLVAIDIPIALKLYLLENKKIYLLTGINSSSYMSERYTYRSASYNFQTFSPNPDQVSKSSFSSFDLGSSGILGFGFQAQLGKIPLLFETYYKPAFNGLGARNIKLNSAGINLRMPLTKSQ